MTGQAQYIKDIKDPTERAHVLKFIRTTFSNRAVQTLILDGIPSILPPEDDITKLPLRKQVNYLIEDYKKYKKQFVKWDKLSYTMIRDLLLNVPASKAKITADQFNNCIHSLTQSDTIKLLKKYRKNWKVKLDRYELGIYSFLAIIKEFPEYQVQIDVDGLSDWDTIEALRVVPGLISKIDVSYFDPDDWSDLLADQPCLASHCDWDKFNGEDLWIILTHQPQLADKCDLSLMAGSHWVQLLDQHPTLIKYVKWESLNEYQWKLIKEDFPKLKAFINKNMNNYLMMREITAE